MAPRYAICMSLLKSIIGFLWVLSTPILAARASATATGHVAVWHNGKPVTIEVNLNSDSITKLENKHISLKNPPGGLGPNSSGCFCFNLNDERFAFVHAFYYADQQLREINHVLQEVNLPLVSGVTLNLQQMGPGSTSVGGTDFDGKSINITYVQPAIDISILAHEIGHAIHMQVTGKSFKEILAIPEDPFKVSLEQLKLFGFQMNVVEGAAQLSSVFFTGDSRVGRFDWLDAADELNNFVRFPDLVPTAAEHWKSWAHAPLFSAAYPKSADLAQKILKNDFNFPWFKESQNLPFPYTASAAIIQPLLWASNRFGRNHAMKTYLKAFAEMKSWRGYRDWSEALAKAATSTELAKFLHTQYEQRGLFTNDANP